MASQRTSMITNKASHSAGAGNGVHLDLAFPKTPDRPFSLSRLVESCVPLSYFRPRMPIIPIGLNDQPSLLEHEVGLPPPKHGFVHLELESALLEFTIQEPLDGGHLLGEYLVKSRLAHLLSSFWGRYAFKGALAHLLTCLRRELLAQSSLANLLTRFRRQSLSKTGLPKFLATNISQSWRMTAKMRQAHPLDAFRRMVATLPHVNIIPQTN